MTERADLGKALHDLRTARGLTGVELAKLVGVAQTSISRYELGVRLPTAEMLERIADALGASKRLKGQLLGQLHEALTQVRSVRAMARRGLRRRQEEVARQEAGVQNLRIFQPALIPGLLQTPDYARRIFESVAERTGARDIPQALAARLDRQAILYEPTRQFGFVITEAVLRWPRGGVSTMLGQLDRIQSVMALPNVDLAIVPLDVEPPQTPLTAFVLYDQDLVVIETLTEELALRDPTDVALYAKAYEAFRQAAVSGAEVHSLLASVAADLRQRLPTSS